MGWCCVLERSNGGSPNGCVTYYEPYSNYTEAVKECDRIFEEEEVFCERNEHHLTI